MSEPRTGLSADSIVALGLIADGLCFRANDTEPARYRMQAEQMLRAAIEAEAAEPSEGERLVVRVRTDAATLRADRDLLTKLATARLGVRPGQGSVFLSEKAAEAILRMFAATVEVAPPPSIGFPAPLPSPEAAVSERLDVGADLWRIRREIEARGTLTRPVRRAWEVVWNALAAPQGEEPNR